ncbi:MULTISPECIES: hypothetical protein [unclassified Streptomyces]|uniref:hypothetical protein n=1 Tax=unclassified Streptomyces TaxID=2593676 RepID=UPI002DDB0178|nr:MULTISPECIES: hypothetical protein [unclassified Streptomyces]WSA91632.1 hypothetical protein OIE63_08700 [Streptomyces sp. NBC_01795]WSB76003.1 hypothetical protein OHB04_09505 [Streptomyces sp. NBC_01775]WSS15722.1 hypothetical protein OG533_30430 [Streptomyces sp. NBC_01186]WSS44562.1 hypothetical protein OG220_31220 [Streptomyces sp. NBC_01187]
MSSSMQAAAHRRRQYTGEGHQQAIRALGRLSASENPIPAPASPAQERLEATVFLRLLETRDCFTRYPLGLVAVHPTPTGITLELESEERAAEVLFELLPTSAPDDEELHGLAGLRITKRLRTAIELRVLGRAAQLRLGGLPSTTWHRAEQATHAKWIDPDTMRFCWSASPTRRTAREQEHALMWEDDADSFVRTWQRGAWLGSALLRRAALLHTSANTYLVDGYRGAASNLTRWVVRSSHTPERGPGPHHIVAALLDPVFGVPLRLTRFRGDTDEGPNRDQHFVLEDPDKTAVLELRTTAEKPPARLSAELWQAILRRMPDQAGDSSLSPETIVRLCGSGSGEISA